MSIVVTGATGSLGRLVIDELLDRVPADQVAAVVRDKDKAADLAGRGVELRIADYNAPENPRGRLPLRRPGPPHLRLRGRPSRTAAHRRDRCGEGRGASPSSAYTGILGGPDADFDLADEHKVTEQLILDSGLPHTFLRNGWYTENYTANLAPVLAHSAVVANRRRGPCRLRRPCGLRRRRGRRPRHGTATSARSTN